MTTDFLGKRRIHMLWLISGTAILLAGCPGDRAMFCEVRMHVLDETGEPLAGETVCIISRDQNCWPRVRRDAATDPVRYDEIRRTDANGLVEFVATNTEPVAIPTSIVIDMFYPPRVRFLITLPARRLPAYAVTFVPGGDYGKDRFSYRHFDLKTGRMLRPTYRDASGGLDIAVLRPPRDPNDPWSVARPSLDVRVSTGEDTSGASLPSSSGLSGELTP